jgi:hypothetical protein
VNESEWLRSDDPPAMLRLLMGMKDDQSGTLGPSDRKLRLFACARARVLAKNPHSFHNIPMAERGNIISAVESLADGADGPPFESLPYWPNYLTMPPLQAASHAAHIGDSPFAALLREIVGNPFRPVLRADQAPMSSPHPPYWLFKDEWLTPTALSLAQAAYDERLLDGTLDPVRLMILADALEEAGCDEALLLAHCRSPEGHVRGCWALDLLLAKQ